MKDLGLIRTELVRLWYQRFSDEELEVVNRFGEYLIDAAREYTHAEGRGRVEEAVLVLTSIAREIKALSTWAFQEFPEIRDAVREESFETWQAGYLTDYGMWLHRFLAVLGARIEEAVLPTREAVLAWRESLPSDLPRWYRGQHYLQLHPPRRPPIRTAECYRVSESLEEVKVLCEFLALAEERVRLVRGELTADGEAEGASLSALSADLETLAAHVGSAKEHGEAMVGPRRRARDEGSEEKEDD